MDNTWIVIASASEAFIYSLDQEAHSKGKIKIDLITNLSHPQSRKKDEELITDRSGHYFSNTGTIGPGSYKTPTDPKKHEADLFAKEIAKELENARIANRFSHLVLIAAPHFYGLLKKHINKNVSNMISMNIEKDYTKAPNKQLLGHLEQHLLNSK